MKRETIIVAAVTALILLTFFLGGLRSTGNVVASGNENMPAGNASVTESLTLFNIALIIALAVIVALWYYYRKIRKEMEKID